jgi:DNA primase catalytic subunit
MAWLDSSRVDRNRFHKHLFPAMVACGLLRLVTCDGQFDMERCELAGRWVIDEQDVFQRHHSFVRAEEVVTYCKEKNPYTLQLGGALPQSPTTSTGCAMGALVLDIDANDYPMRGAICACGADRTVCQDCWNALIEPARRVTRYLLCELYGFGHVFDVFSGRRGVHTWCYDARVLRWTQEERTNFMSSIAASTIVRNAPAAAAAIESLLRSSIPSSIKVDRLNREELFERFYPRFDIKVSTDAAHLKGLPLSMHHDTRYVRVPLPMFTSRERFLLTQHRMRPADMSVYEAEFFTTQILKLAFD